MAEFNASITDTTPYFITAEGPDSDMNDRIFSSVSGANFKFKMRGLADPGPGYVVWVTQGTPDLLGTQAPSAIQSGTVVIADSWDAS